MKQRLLWYSYDFANSFAGIVLIFYFPLILIERGGLEEWIGVASSAATACMLVILPRIGNYADRTGRGRMFIFGGTLFATVMLFVLVLLFSFTEPSFLTTLVALVCYGLFYIGYEIAITIYSGMLRLLSEKTTVVHISGIGYASGQFGNVACLIVTNIFVTSGIIFYGVTGKPLGLLIGALGALIGTLPFVFSLPKVASVVESYSSQFSYKRLVMMVHGDGRLRMYLFITILLYDTILTFQLYVTSYLKIVFDFSDSMVIYAGIVGLGFGVLGALLGGLLVRVFGSAVRVLMYSSLLYAVCAFLFSIATDSIISVFLLLAVSGISYGLLFSVGRAVYALIIPKEMKHEYFGMYTVFERMAAVVGPLLWMTTFFAVSSYGNVAQYRVSVFGLACIALCAFLLLIHFDRRYRLEDYAVTLKNS